MGDSIQAFFYSETPGIAHIEDLSRHQSTSPCILLRLSLLTFHHPSIPLTSLKGRWPTFLAWFQNVCFTSRLLLKWNIFPKRNLIQICRGCSLLFPLLQNKLKRQLRDQKYPGPWFFRQFFHDFKGKNNSYIVQWPKILGKWQKCAYSFDERLILITKLNNDNSSKKQHRLMLFVNKTQRYKIIY